MRTIIDTSLRVIDRLSGTLGLIAILCLVVLICAMSIEVFSRHVLGNPTMWAFDISSMASGLLYVTAAGAALREGQHIMVDFLHTRMPLPWQHASHLVLYVLLLLPALVVLSHAGIAETWEAYVQHETTKLSPMALPVWPYNAAITAGLIVLTLQALAQAMRHALGLYDTIGWAKPAVPVSAE